MERFLVRVDALGVALRLFSSEGIAVKRLFPFISACEVAVTAAGMSKVRALPCVKSVHADCKVLATDAPTGTQAPSRKERADPPLPPPVAGRDKKRKTCVAVIDTGVSEHLDLTLFPSKIAFFSDFIGGVDFPYDDCGHGTAVAGMVCGSGLMRGDYMRRLFPNVKIVALKALGAGGEGNAFDILTAMQWVYDNRNEYNIKVVNLSLGYVAKEKNDPLMLGAEALVKSGLTVVCSAGNGALAGEGILSPGISPYVITVGGSDGNRPADFSARGKKGSGKPDLVAPAVDLPVLDARGGYGVLSGTSMAAPKVSALCAELLHRYPSYTPERVKSLIKSTALPMDGDEREVGAGLANFDILRAAL